MRRSCLQSLALCALALMVNMPAAADDTAAKSPRPEHPFPQMVRTEWLNLNGTWEFAETNDAKDTSWLGEKAYPDKIVVPFCRESKLSGLARTGFVKNVWYRRTFQKPAEWKSPRVRLHIGACDWKTSVWINGKQAGGHIGGNAPFCFDVTDLLKPGDNTVVVHAFDDTRSGLQATGKQAHSEKSEGCCYTRTTGIWQTVWLEGVGSAFISDVRVEFDRRQSRVILQAEVDGLCQGMILKATALADGGEVASDETPADWRNNRLVLSFAQPRLWSVEDPFLYDLKLSLVNNGETVDAVDSYIGLRDVTIRGGAILINGKPVFQRTVLDQGFYPEGVWTAPTDAALRDDIKMSQAVGFNGARLHQKVFDPRYLYWADKLGYLVWGEFPNWGMDYRNTAINLPVVDEWVEILRRDRNHPAIIGWCPFNESGNEAVPLQNTVVNLIRAVDPSRPTIDSSGWVHGLTNPDVLDAHDYEENPAKFRATWADAFKTGVLDKKYRGSSTSNGPIPFFVSEFGGIGFNVATDGFGYGQTPKDLEAFYTRFKGVVDAQLDNPNLFGYCYTQLTDVEQEQNGIYTYARKPKFDVKRLHEIQSRAAAYEKNPPLGQQEKK
jgi:beta-galactosidase/beta-glucuronidase